MRGTCKGWKSPELGNRDLIWTAMSPVMMLYTGSYTSPAGGSQPRTVQGAEYRAFLQLTTVAGANVGT